MSERKPKSQEDIIKERFLPRRPKSLPLHDPYADFQLPPEQQDDIVTDINGYMPSSQRPGYIPSWWEEKQ